MWVCSCEGATRIRASPTRHYADIGRVDKPKPPFTIARPRVHHTLNTDELAARYLDKAAIAGFLTTTSLNRSISGEPSGFLGNHHHITRIPHTISAGINGAAG